MATKQLPALPEATTAEDNDLLLKRDDSSGSDQKLTIQKLRELAFGDAADESVSVTATPDTLAKRDSIGRIQAASGGSGNETVVHDDTSTSPNADTVAKRDSSGGIEAAYVNTGQGDNEVYAMDQNVRTTDDVEFNQVTANTFVGVDEYTDQDALDLFNVSGSAPVYACRAWVNFNGRNTVSILESGNVSSVTDNGTGDYTVNFATDMPDDDYAVIGIGVELDSFIRVLSSAGGSVFPKSTSSVRFGTRNAGNSTSDTDFVNVAIFR